MAEELIPQAFTLRSSLHESSYVVELDNSGDDYTGVYYFGKLFKSWIWNVDDAYVWLDRCKRIVRS